MTEILFDKLVLYWIGLAILVFIVNMKIIAPYGRHAAKGWGIFINNRVAWILMESPVLILVLYFTVSNYERLNIVVWTLVFFFSAHYIHRTFIYPFRLKGSKKKMPIGVVSLAILFNLFNGFFIGYYLGNYSDYSLSWFTSLPFILGIIVFGVGAYINWKADTMLLDLRTDDFDGYRIPNGFLFNKVSCPNHLGEIIEWSGYALMSYNLPALAFAIWTAANLIPRAFAHHKWYKNYFDNYPKERKAVIPGLV
jgi:3-oxo-5-alpha-steroid 4-dehydrogenase 1